MTFLAGFDDFGELLGSACSYPRIDLSDRGDAFLFRPVFYLFLSLEYWLFRVNFLGWQVVGFLLHLLVVWKLAEVLWRIRPTYFVFPIVLNFSVLLIGLEMVIWQHINGYLLCLFVILLAFDQLVLYWQEDEKNEARVRSMVTLLTLASFIYEVGLVCYVVFVGFLVATSRKRNFGAWLFLPLAAYFLINAFDYFFINRVDASTFQFAKNFNLLRFGQSVLSVSLMALYGWLVPSFTDIALTLRLFFTFQDRPRIAENFAAQGGFYVLNVLLLIAGAVALLICVLQRGPANAAGPAAGSRPRIAQRAAGLAATIFVAVILLISLRVAGHPFAEYHRLSLYYFYITTAFLFLAVYGWGARCAAALPPARRGLLKVLLASALVLSIGLNATKAHALNAQLRYLYAPWRTFFGRLDAFVVQHRTEPDFSFQLVWRQPMRVPEYKIEDQGDRFASRYFSRFMGGAHAKYFLLYYYREGVLPFSNLGEAHRYARTHPLPSRELFP